MKNPNVNDDRLLLENLIANDRRKTAEEKIQSASLVELNKMLSDCSLTLLSGNLGAKKKDKLALALVAISQEIIFRNMEVCTYLAVHDESIGHSHVSDIGEVLHGKRNVLPEDAQIETAIYAALVRGTPVFGNQATQNSEQ